MNIANTNPDIKSKDGLTILLFCLIVISALFWIIANTINIYKYAVAGAIFEILWLPVLLATFSIPIVSIICWYRKGLGIKSPFLYIAIVSAVILAFSLIS